MTDALGGVDLGGSHVAASVIVDGQPRRVVDRRFDAAERTTSSTLDLIAACMSEAGCPQRWIVAAPGPFDYAAGRCLITGLSKLDELFDVDLRAELTLRIPDARFDFVNDAQAAGLGEWEHGAGERARRMLYLGIGTGLGSAFVDAGQVLEDDRRVPPGGHIGLTKFEGGLADDHCSTRGLLEGTGHRDARELVRAARAGSTAELVRVNEFGRSLEQIVDPWRERFDPQRIVIGGGLSHAHDLIADGFADPDLRSMCAAAVYSDTAALFGIHAFSQNP